MPGKRGSPDSHAVVDAALATANALGCTPPPSTCVDLGPRLPKGGGPNRLAEEARAAQARTSCVAALRHCPAR